ncbi:uncharacterized protein [Cicer arietinum]|uniref:uncharacterized protein n=1 Tax=Cicer arietinum TaxID=3827 RepID=UPI003CC52B68
MEDAESVVDHFNHVKTITNQMNTNGEMMTDLVIIEKILRTLTQIFDHIVVAIVESKDLETLKVEELQGSLEAHEFRVKERSTTKTFKQALQAHVSKRANQDEGKYKMGKGKSKWHKKQDSVEMLEIQIIKIVMAITTRNLMAKKEEKGYSVKMEHGQMKMFDSSRRLVLKAQLSNNRNLKIEIQISEKQCLATEVGSDNWLWHQRFGHLNFRSLQMLKNKNMVQGLPEIQIPK